MDALQPFVTAAGLAPDDADLHFYAGLCLYRNKRIRDARRMLETAVRLNPVQAEPYFMLARVYDERGTYPQAEAYAREYLSRTSRAAPGHYLLAKIYAAQALREKAEREISLALDLEPDNFQYWYLQGRIFQGFGRNERLMDAIRAFETALKRNPDHAESHTSLGRALLQAGRPADAVAHLDMGLRLSSQPGPLHYDLAQALLRTGRKEEGRKELARHRAYSSYIIRYNQLSRQIDRKSSDPGLRMQLAKFCLDSAQPEAAELILKEAIHQIPRSASNFYEFLATVYHEMGKEALAIVARDHAKRKDAG